MRQIWTSKSINTRIKLRLINTIILPTVLYACESWRLTKNVAQKINTFQQRCLRRILGINYLSHTTNEEILARSSSRSLQDTVTNRRMRFVGHILRLPKHRHARTAIEWIPKGGKRKQGRPKKTWRATFKEDLQLIQIPWSQIAETAADRGQWGALVALCTMYQRN